MAASIKSEIDALYRMTTDELVERYAELHGHRSRTRHRQYLIRKNAWRIQANAESDLSERARKRAAELANDAEVRVMAPKTLICPPQTAIAGTIARPLPNGDPVRTHARQAPSEVNLPHQTRLSPIRRQRSTAPMDAYRPKGVALLSNGSSVADDAIEMPLDRLERSNMVQRILEELDEQDRMRVLLAFMQSMTCRNAACELHAQLDTVLSRIQRARERVAGLVGQLNAVNKVDGGRRGVVPATPRHVGAGMTRITDCGPRSKIGRTS